MVEGCGGREQESPILLGCWVQKAGPNREVARKRELPSLIDRSRAHQLRPTLSDSSEPEVTSGLSLELTDWF